ncbi:NEDD4 family-interacting protein 2 [Myotis brandtii]|uniref:NEDD4 family-interacting protein 2 n=1 Tax=Myotis brandtii TaxID=109478 RepID=S7MFL1_MYOBR|nr:NEDD4 family-interacting protein 2 [Myotis brandtii]
MEKYPQLYNEEDNSESSAIEQPSTSNPAPQIVQTAPSALVFETDSSPPPYSSITVEVPTTSDAEVYNEFYPVPPPYSVATSLPTYDEAEKAKAAAMAAAAAETSQRIQEEECSPRDDFSDADQLRVGNDGIFMLAFFMAFIFNWLGFCLSFCITNTIAGRYGAICGFGLSLIKWILIVRSLGHTMGPRVKSPPTHVCLKIIQDPDPAGPIHIKLHRVRGTASGPLVRHQEWGADSGPQALVPGWEA